MSRISEKKGASNLIPPLLCQADELSIFRGDMLKFARMHLRNDDSAEDAVQEALTSAYASLKKFNNQAQLKTWVFSILKNKIVDIIRDRVRSPNVAVDINEIPENAIDDMFDDQGRWQDDTCPINWDSPEKCFSNDQFWQVFEMCLTRLPENAARTFMMREIMGFDTDEICKDLAISPENCWVILHRARMMLRLCLNERWFKSENHNAEL
jgi:RNA polymerase sigma-70 factor (ECF subfamily)